MVRHLIFCALLTGCVRRAPPNDRALEANARCVEALTRGALVDAEALCDHSLEFCPYFWDALTNKGVIRKLRGDREGAKRLFIQALRENADQAQAANDLGVMYLEERRWAEAEGLFRQALTTNPDYAEARWNVALVALERGRLDDAEQAFRHLIIAAPNVTKGHLGLGRTLLLKRRLGEALDEFTQATLLEPGLADAWFLLAVTQLEVQKLEDARHSLGRCLDEAPEHERCAALSKSMP